MEINFPSRGYTYRQGTPRLQTDKVSQKCRRSGRRSQLISGALWQEAPKSSIISYGAGMRTRAPLSIREGLVSTGAEFDPRYLPSPCGIMLVRVNYSTQIYRLPT